MRERFKCVTAACPTHHQTAAQEATMPTIVMRIPKRQEIALEGRRKVSDALREIGVPPVTVPVIAEQTRRAPCSGCGLAKRYLFNREAAERGYAVVATGHNLDDEAATLLGNVLHWQSGYLARQSPVLEAEDSGLVRKVKPLYRLSEHDTA